MSENSLFHFFGVSKVQVFSWSFWHWQAVNNHRGQECLQELGSESSPCLCQASSWYSLVELARCGWPLDITALYMGIYNGYIYIYKMYMAIICIPSMGLQVLLIHENGIRRKPSADVDYVSLVFRAGTVVWHSMGEKKRWFQSILWHDELRKPRELTTKNGGFSISRWFWWKMIARTSLSQRFLCCMGISLSC